LVSYVEWSNLHALLLLLLSLFFEKLNSSLYNVISLRFFFVHNYITDEDKDDVEKVSYTRDMCAQLSQHMLHVHNLPIECMKYNDVVEKLKGQEKDMNHPTSWMT
jgi:hypothetical protein